jgi:hypothetical protein
MGASETLGCIQSGQAAYNFSLGADRWDILGVSIESLGVSEYLIFDLKRTSFSSKAPLLYRFCTPSGLWHNLSPILLSKSPISEIDVDPSPNIAYAGG